MRSRLFHAVIATGIALGTASTVACSGDDAAEDPAPPMAQQVDGGATAEQALLSDSGASLTDAAVVVAEHPKDSYPENAHHDGGCLDGGGGVVLDDGGCGWFPTK